MTLNTKKKKKKKKAKKNKNGGKNYFEVEGNPKKLTLVGEWQKIYFYNTYGLKLNCIEVNPIFLYN